MTRVFCLCLCLLLADCAVPVQTTTSSAPVRDTTFLGEVSCSPQTDSASIAARSIERRLRLLDQELRILVCVLAIGAGVCWWQFSKRPVNPW